MKEKREGNNETQCQRGEEGEEEGGTKMRQGRGKKEGGREGEGRKESSKKLLPFFPCRCAAYRRPPVRSQTHKTIPHSCDLAGKSALKMEL